MAARDDQVDAIKAAAQYLRGEQESVQSQGFSLQNVTVMLPEDADGVAAQVTFTWRDDHYIFTVS